MTVEDFFQRLLNWPLPQVPASRRALWRFVGALEISLGSFVLHARGKLPMPDLPIGAYVSAAVFLITLTWAIFYYWELIFCNRDQWEFRQLVPELEDVIEYLVLRSTDQESSSFSAKTERRRNELLARLERMELPRPGGKDQSTYLSEVLDYAKNGKYKECQDFLEKEDKRFIEDLDLPF